MRKLVVAKAGRTQRSSQRLSKRGAQPCTTPKAEGKAIPAEFRLLAVACAHELGTRKAQRNTRAAKPRWTLTGLVEENRPNKFACNFCTSVENGPQPSSPNTAAPGAPAGQESKRRPDCRISLSTSDCPALRPLPPVQPELEEAPVAPPTERASLSNAQALAGPTNNGPGAARLPSGAATDADQKATALTEPIARAMSGPRLSRPVPASRPPTLGCTYPCCTLPLGSSASRRFRRGGLTRALCHGGNMPAAHLQPLTRCLLRRWLTRALQRQRMPMHGCLKCCSQRPRCSFPTLWCKPAGVCATSCNLMGTSLPPPWMSASSCSAGRPLQLKSIVAQMLSVSHLSRSLLGPLMDIPLPAMLPMVAGASKQTLMGTRSSVPTMAPVLHLTAKPPRLASRMMSPLLPLPRRQQRPQKQQQQPQPAVRQSTGARAPPHSPQR